MPTFKNDSESTLHRMVLYVHLWENMTTDEIEQTVSDALFKVKNISHTEITDTKGKV